MSVKSGQAITVRFTTANPATGAAVDADSLPTAVLTVNGTNHAAAVTVADVGVGRYTASVTLPTLSAGDCVAIEVAATVLAAVGAGIVWQDVADTKRVSDLHDIDGDAVDVTVNPTTLDASERSAIAAAVVAAEGNGGDLPCTHRVLLDTDGDTDPDSPAVGIPGVTCVLTSDAAGNMQVGSAKVTDSLGNATWRGLVAGRYYVWRSKPGYTFADPDTEDVAAT